MMRLILLAAGTLACAIGQTPARAAILRPFTQITAGTVRLADLFDNLGATPDRVLGHAPAPGARIVVGSPQLAAIARDFNVDWRPQTGGEQAVLERRGAVLPKAHVLAALRQALIEAGATGEFDVASPDIQPVLLPVGAAPEPTISQVSYEPAPGQGARFTALVSVEVPDAEAVELRVSGQVIPMAMAMVANRRLSPGSVVQEGDVRAMRVRATLLHGGAGLSPDAALGLALRHDVPEGQVVTAGDLVRPSLVQRGAVVRMTLRSDGLQLTAQGIAVEAGGRGDAIRVENPLSHRVVSAVVTGADEVSVAPRAATISLVSAQ